MKWWKNLLHLPSFNIIIIIIFDDHVYFECFSFVVCSSILMRLLMKFRWAREWEQEIMYIEWFNGFTLIFIIFSCLFSNTHTPRTLNPNGKSKCSVILTWVELCSEFGVRRICWDMYILATMSLNHEEQSKGKTRTLYYFPQNCCRFGWHSIRSSFQYISSEWMWIWGAHAWNVQEGVKCWCRFTLK